MVARGVVARGGGTTKELAGWVWVEGVSIVVGRKTRCKVCDSGFAS